MWTYVQRTGELIASDGEVVGVGYAGNGPKGKNNPDAQDQHNVGPLPVGEYRIGAPTNAHPHLGPFALPLTPNGQEMYGRSGFFMHGDSILNPGFASDGCVIQAKTVRQRVAKSDDHELRVIAERADLVLPSKSTDVLKA